MKERCTRSATYLLNFVISVQQAWLTGIILALIYNQQCRACHAIRPRTYNTISLLKAPSRSHSSGRLLAQLLLFAAAADHVYRLQPHEHSSSWLHTRKLFPRNHIPSSSDFSASLVLHSTTHDWVTCVYIQIFMRTAGVCVSTPIIAECICMCVLRVMAIDGRGGGGGGGDNDRAQWFFVFPTNYANFHVKNLQRETLNVFCAMIGIFKNRPC